MQNNSLLMANFGTGCIRIFPALLAAVAFLFSLLANFWCRLVKYDPESPGTFGTAHFGIFSYSQLSSVEFSWGDGQFTTESECAAYNENIDLDDAWRAAQAFAIISTIIGAIVSICLWLVPCFSRLTSDGIWTVLTAVCLFLLPFCQGLTFLLFQSQICKDNPVLGLFGALGIYKDSCQLSSGGFLNIAAIIVWFLAGVFMAVFRDRLT